MKSDLPEDILYKIMDRVYPVGSAYWNEKDDRDPSIILGFGRWRKQSAAVLAGHSDSSNSPFNVSGGTIIGSHDATLTTSNLPAHTHTGSTNTTGAHNHNVRINGGDGGMIAGGGGSQQPQSGAGYSWKALREDTAGSHSHTFTTNSTGSGTAFSIIQHSLVGYLWIREA